MAEAVLLFQRGFWVGTTKDPELTVVEHMPDNLFILGFIHVGVALLLLGLAQWCSPGSRTRFRSVSDGRVNRRGRRHQVFTIRYHRTLKQMTVAASAARS